MVQDPISSFAVTSKLAISYLQFSFAMSSTVKPFPLKAEYGDVLTFFLKELPPCVPITWSMDKKEYTKNYYKLRAWFNKPLPSGTEMNVHLEKAQGEQLIP
jgi:hypothetical protein